MISSKEYIGVLRASQEVMPELSKSMPEFFSPYAESVFEQFDEIRKQFKVIYAEFCCYELYPRQDMTKFSTCANELNQFVEETDIEIKWFVEIETIMDESDHAKYRDVNPIARFYYKDVEITKLVKLEL